MSIRLYREGGIGKLLLDWHKNLDNDRAARAILKRASSITAVSLAAPYQRLYQRLVAIDKGEQLKPHHRDALAAAVGLIAQVSEDVPGQLPKAMSARDGSGEAPVSDLRFARLLEASDVDSLFVSLRRALPLINNRADVLALASDVLNWGDSVKKNWTYNFEWKDSSKN